MGRATKEIGECVVCGEEFLRRCKTEGRSFLCSLRCNHIWGSSTRNIRVRGRSGGLKMRALWVAGMVLSENPGVAFTSEELHQAMLGRPEIGTRVPSVQSIARLIPNYSVFEVVPRNVSSGAPQKIRVDAPLRFLRDMMLPEHWQSIFENYTTEAVEG